MNALLRMLGIGVPIIQAPMAGVSTPAMAAAVSNAGGLGSIGVGAVDAARAQEMISSVRVQTDRPFNVNLFCHRPAIADGVREAAWLTRLAPEFSRYGAKPPTQLREIYKSFVADDAMLAMLLRERPMVVSFHFGLPSTERIAALRDAGIVLLATATNLQEAQSIAAVGIDAVVAQGFEAGGHRGVFDPDSPDDCLGTIALTRLLACHLAIPVIAAGGIMDGAGIAACLLLGAHAAQLGTAFIACPESAADEGYRATLLSAAPKHTVMTRAISGRPARCLANRFTALEKGDAGLIPDYPIAYDAGKALNAAAKIAGEIGFGAQWAGQAAAARRATCLPRPWSPSFVSRWNRLSRVRRWAPPESSTVWLCTAEVRGWADENHAHFERFDGAVFIRNCCAIGTLSPCNQGGGRGGSASPIGTVSPRGILSPSLHPLSPGVPGERGELRNTFQTKGNVGFHQPRARLLPSRKRRNPWPYTLFFAGSRLGRSLARLTLPLNPIHAFLNDHPPQRASEIF